MTVTMKLMLRNYLTAAQTNINQAVKDVAAAIQADARQRCDVETGSAQAAIYVSDSDGDGYGEALSAATSLDSKVNPVADECPKAVDGTAFVATAIDHCTFLELGTVRMAAHPYLTPAAEAQRQPLSDQLGAILNHE